MGREIRYISLFILLTCCMEQSPSCEANWFLASQKFPTFCGTRRFITTFTSAHHLPLSWERSIVISVYLIILYNIYCTYLF